MKCINNRLIPRCISGLIISLLLILFALLSGCGINSIRIPYDASTTVRAFNFDSYNTENCETPFAANICIAAEDTTSSSVDMSETLAAGLFNITNNETLYIKGANTKLAPASLTKIMTAYLALKYGRLDDVLTASENVTKIESGAQMCGFKEGDQLTLDQVLYGLLLYSGNDAGVMVAEYISGSVEQFADLMNKEALMLGASNTHFTNPHGLNDEDHYTTMYDLYLIFNAALKYDKFREIIHTSEYKSSYTDKEGNPKDIKFSTTNYYTADAVKAPKNVTVIGGKTGSTKAAGSCLILVSNNSAGESFISVVMNTKDRETLYSQMNNLLELIP